MKVCIDVDDCHTHPKWDCSDVLLRILDRFPEAKFTLFFTPFMKKIRADEYPEALERLRGLVDQGRAELFPHGFTHTRIIKGEFGALPRPIARRRIRKSARLCASMGLDCKSGHKFPWNVYNQASLRAMTDLDMILFSNKYEPFYAGRQVAWIDRGRMLKRRLRPKAYPRIKPLVTEGVDVLYYHGHAQNVRHTGIRQARENLLEELAYLDKSQGVEFIFCSELAE